ncbi:ABC transporter substrate-binding protein [Nocardioides hwasunensis]|uniref:ABC transporter substrate-binding protein n=1 Tax=Nocardioides hwasunensis TaxID=397258 RepID=A0ABR8MMX8_9ACTN|nr:ABC transporter substrate-binding protein [Nocardioides hwasunensis]MBD3916162.1 ABC transporter substrate-binding protein [Nocardioides hwasunensis]
MRPAHLTTLLLAATLAAPFLAGCGASEGEAAAPAADGFPRTVETCFGDVTLEDRPERIVSLNQGSTEILLSLGLADRMAGAATWTDPILPSLAEENDKVERLSENSPSLETVLAQEPDLVTASFTGTLGEGGVATSAQLEDEYGLPSYLSAAECGKQESGNSDGAREGTLEMADIYTEIRQLAELTGTEEEGEELVADLGRRMDEAALDVGAAVTAAYWFANSESPYLAGCCGGPGIVSRALGIDNVFVDQTDEWPQINWEVVASADPDVLVIGDLTRKSQTAETAAAKIDFLESHPVTSKMTAVREGRYIHLAGAELNPSLRTVDAVEKVAAGLRDLGLTD